MRITFSILLLFFGLQIQAQILQPVKWDFKSKNISGDEFELTMTAILDDGWATYSQHTSDDGPVPTYFEFDKGAHFDLIGKVEELSKKKEGMDPLFGVNVIKFVGSPVIFKQKVKVKDYSKPITGYLTYMTCDNARCLPPTDVDIEYKLAAPAASTGNSTGAVSNTTQSVAAAKPQPKPEAKAPVIVNKTTPKPATQPEVKTQIAQKEPTKTKQAVAEAKKKVETKEAPVEKVVEATAEEKKAEAPVIVNKQTKAGNLSTGFKIEGNTIDQRIPSIQETYINPISDCGGVAEEDDSLLMTFIFGFLGGLVALLTPCVFPMIPLTVSYFTKSSTDRASGIRNALWYGASIIVIYVAIGMLITALLGPTALNELSTNWIANLIFFFIFVVFAFSFFGYFEITLPASWSNKTDRAADQGGLIGIFFMAFTLALVSFSCTGPIIGSALVESATNKVGPTVVMLGFSSALALPFGLFAAFPGWLNSLPKSGGWMNSVKVVLGFLELGLALKFLSTADLTKDWGVLPYELFMGIWVILCLATFAYLFGFFKFPHDSPVKKITPVRGAFGLLFAGLAFYFASGFMLNPKTSLYKTPALVSGIAPPANYNLFLPPPALNPDLKARFSSYTKCANNLDCFKDYTEGISYAREVGKPVFVDFTGHGCQNCRKVEDAIWVTDDVWSKLQNDFVLVSLYVDDRKKLKSVYKSKSRPTKKLRNVGNKWADFQIVNFKQNSQPLYVMMTNDEKVMTKPFSFEGTDQTSIDNYNSYLDCGLETFKKIQEDNMLGSKE